MNKLRSGLLLVLLGTAVFPGCHKSPPPETLSTPNLITKAQIPSMPIHNVPPSQSPIKSLNERQRYGLMSGVFISGRLLIVRNKLELDSMQDAMTVEWADFEQNSFVRVSTGSVDAVRASNQPGTSIDVEGPVSFIQHLKLFRKDQSVVLFNHTIESQRLTGLLTASLEDLSTWKSLDRGLFYPPTGGEIADTDVHLFDDFLGAWTNLDSSGFQYGLRELNRPLVLARGNIMSRQIRSFGNKDAQWGGVVFNTDEGLIAQTFYLNKPFVSPDQYLIKKTVLMQTGPWPIADGIQRQFHGQAFSAVAAADAGRFSVVAWVETNFTFQTAKLTSETIELKMARTSDQGQSWQIVALPAIPHGDLNNIFLMPYREKIFVVWGNVYFILDPNTMRTSPPLVMPTINPYYIPELVSGEKDLLLCWPVIFEIQP